MGTASIVAHPVILFDGECNFCGGSVQFIIKHDAKHLFRFASLQSGFGQQVLEKYHLPAAHFGSFILLENDIVYTKSAGALRVVKKLNRAWPALYAFIIVPPFIRNAVYDFVAGNRYKWFGKKDACWIPTEELSALFIE